MSLQQLKREKYTLDDMPNGLMFYSYFKTSIWLKVNQDEYKIVFGNNIGRIENRKHFSLTTLRKFKIITLYELDELKAKSL